MDVQASASHIRDPNPHIVCMLAEGLYFHGAAALCNSLIRNGFRGEIAIGYRGALPVWEGPIQPRAGQPMPAAPEVLIRFIPLNDTYPAHWDLMFSKPKFMLEVVDEFGGNFSSLWYFDVDLVVLTQWDNFVRWSEAGSILVLDMAETYMPDTHVFRHEWRALAKRAGLKHRDVNGYFNAGCVGVDRRGLPLIETWATLIDRRRREGARMQKDPSARPEYRKDDQDLLNAAVMACDAPYAVLGMEAMDVFPSSNIMSHAMLFDKPWRRRYVLDALKGYPPDAAHRAFWLYAEGPIRSFPRREWSRRKQAFAFARLLRHANKRVVREW